MVSNWDVSYQLEKICEKKFNCTFDHTCTLFDRNVIENGMFYDVMHLLLHLDNKDGDKAADFIDKYCQYKRTKMADIPNCAEIFDEFKELLDD